MNPKRSAGYYHEECRLLYWTIISVAARRYNEQLFLALIPHLSDLLWATVRDVPRHYLIVKAFCTLCTWPLPVSSSSSDPTLLLSGIMMKTAHQIGLHKPSYAQDFSRFKVEFKDEERRDRVTTWAAVNIVAQRVSTGQGLPPDTIYDATFDSPMEYEVCYRLSDDIQTRLKIESFNNNVTKLLYTNRKDIAGLATDAEKEGHMQVLDVELASLEERVGAEPTSKIESSRCYSSRASG